MKIKLMLKNSLCCVLLLFCSYTFASSPTVMLQTVANQMIVQLEKNKAQLRSNPKIIHRIVDTVLLPYVDVGRMAGMVVGRQYWYSAPPAVRREFVAQFKRLVVNTYASALASYDGDKVIVYPMRGNPQGQLASVSSQVVRKNGQRIGINYKLINIGGVWKIYDFSIENVSIVQNYNSQFANTLANGGMAKLVMQLRAYNQTR